MQIDTDGNESIGHIGGTAGYQSWMLYVPATGGSTSSRATPSAPPPRGDKIPR
jgi:hypothetical protein